MSELSRNIALGAAAVGAGAVIVGATILSNNPSLTSNSGGGNGSGGGSTVSVTVRDIHPAVAFTSPADGDVFFTPGVNMAVNFKDTIGIGFTLTAPNRQTCDLGNYYDTTDNWSTASGASYSVNIDLTQCQQGLYGEYKLKVTSHARPESVYAERTFYLSRFDLKYTTTDRGDPLFFMYYGAGIERVNFSAQCAGSSDDILNGYFYTPEQNEEYMDEVLLPLKDKGVSAGSCTVTATATRSNGQPLNSQDASPRTATATFEYLGL